MRAEDLRSLAADRGDRAVGSTDAMGRPPGGLPHDRRPGQRLFACAALQAGTKAADGGRCRRVGGRCRRVGGSGWVGRRRGRDPGVSVAGSTVVGVVDVVVDWSLAGSVGGVEPSAPVAVLSVASISAVPSSPSPARPASATTKPMVTTAATPAAARPCHACLRRPHRPPRLCCDPAIGTPSVSRAAAAFALSSGGAKASGTSAKRRSGARTSSRSAAQASQPPA
jgi:hypothetical protein